MSGHYIQYIVVIVWPSDQVVSRSGKHMDAGVSYAVISRWPSPSTRPPRSHAQPAESDRAVGEAYRL